MLPGVGAISPTGQGQAAMNASQFNEMGRSIAASLSQIRDEADVERLLGGLDGVWGQLSPDQKKPDSAALKHLWIPIYGVMTHGQTG